MKEAFGDKAATMTLPDILKALAERLPERFSPDPDYQDDYRVRVMNSRERIIMREGVANSYGLMVLEHALREECVALGWGWSIQTNLSMGKPYEACIAWNDSYGEGDTPAEALCKAMLDALENVE